MGSFSKWASKNCFRIHLRQHFPILLEDGQHLRHLTRLKLRGYGCFALVFSRFSAKIWFLRFLRFLMEKRKIFLRFSTKKNSRKIATPSLAVIPIVHVQQRIYLKVQYSTKALLLKYLEPNDDIGGN